jgi:hypothetical protein
MVMDLEICLHDVSDYLEHDDNRNIILRNRKGKHLWRLLAASKKCLVNNPFFQQIPTTSVADVLRIVDRDTEFIGCFEHVLGAQSKSRVHEYDLLAILFVSSIKPKAIDSNASDTNSRPNISSVDILQTLAITCAVLSVSLSSTE